jgi:hypothetical protein
LQGSIFLALGACGAVLIGVTAPFPVSYEAVHIPLAFATFIFLTGGIGGYLLVGSRYLWQTNRSLSIGLSACCALVGGILSALIYLQHIPDFFKGDSLWTTLALWEWLLCASIAIFLIVLEAVCRNVQTAADERTGEHRRFDRIAAGPHRNQSKEFTPQWSHRGR